MLEQAPEIRRPILWLDHDAAGIEAEGCLTEILPVGGIRRPSFSGHARIEMRISKPDMIWRPRVRRNIPS